MRMFSRNAGWTLAAALALTACQAPLTPVTAPAVVPHEGLTLRVHPVLTDGVSVMATQPKLTAADLDTLEVFLEVKSGDAFVPIDATSGQPKPDTPNPLKLRLDAPLDLDPALRFTHLKPDATYRVVARAYKGGRLVSVPEASQVEVSVGTDATLDPITLPVKLQTPFAASTQLEVALWGAFPVANRLEISLTHPVRGLVASLSVPKTSLHKPLALTSLNADTTYTLDVQVFASGNPTPIGTASSLIPVLADPALGSRSIDFDLKRQWSVYNAQYLGVDAAGNLYLTVLKGNQDAADIIRYGRDGSVTTTSIPFRVDGIAVTPDGTRYLMGTPRGDGYYQVVRLLSDSGDYEVLSSNYVSSIATDAAGNLYAGVSWQILKFAPGATTGTLAASLVDTPRGIVPLADGTFYYWSLDGLYHSGSSTRLLTQSNIGGVVRTPDDQLLVAVRNAPLWRFDPVAKTQVQVLANVGSVWTLVRDARGLLYMVVGSGTVTVF